MHTEHRPHAAPKGQETLIRVGRIHRNKKVTASVGAEKPERVGGSGRESHRTHLSTSSTGTALTDKALTVAPRGWEGMKQPCSQRLPGFLAQAPRRVWWPPVQPLSPTRAEWPSTGRASGTASTGPTEAQEYEDEGEDGGLSSPSLPTWADLGEEQ